MHLLTNKWKWKYRTAKLKTGTLKDLNQVNFTLNDTLSGLKKYLARYTSFISK